jgi:hypothetical protein
MEHTQLFVVVIGGVIPVGSIVVEQGTKSLHKSAKICKNHPGYFHGELYEIAITNNVTFAFHAAVHFCILVAWPVCLHVPLAFPPTECIFFSLIFIVVLFFILLFFVDNDIEGGT